MGLKILELLIFISLHYVSNCKVTVKNNAYRGLVIAINPDVDENPAIIESLKSSWTDASRDLFRATKNRVYFKRITILVPKTWTNGNYNPSNGESYKKAEVVVADQNPVYGDNPYTVQYGKCSERGSYIHLTPGYLTNDQAITNYGPRGKTLVHEWAHYRWGVFDETATLGYDPFYLSSAGKIEANRCPATIQGDNYYVDWLEGIYRACKTEPQTMLPEDGCVFFPDEERSSAASASMMSYQYLDSVNIFCHDDTEDAPNIHNREAPNEHNRLCNLRSTWDVIMDSADFANGEDNLPNGDIEDTTPEFDVVRPTSYQRFVLVLDTSGSMEGERLLMMNQAASTFILQAAPTGSDIGMVEFSSSASTLSDIVRINDYDDRQELNAKLPNDANGGTSIGSGILEALEVLNKDCNEEDKGSGTAPTPTSCTNGGILIVLSDGEENTDPRLTDVYQDIIDAGVIVHSMVFTANADPMLQVIAQDTGGTWYFSDDANATSSLTDAFVTVARVDDGDTHRETFQIHSSSFSVADYATYTGEVVVDQTIGNNTVFTFTWSLYDISPGVVLEAPNGCTYSTDVPPGTACEPGSSPIIDYFIKTVTFPIAGTAQMGTWKYYVSSAGAYSQNIVVTVTSMASDRDVEPIIVESGMGTVTASDGEAVVVYAQVSMGYAPVLQADVIATVERPTGGPVSIVLKDKGAAPDVRKHDGIYSRYFTQYNGPGRYSVQVSVTGLEGKTTSAYDNAGSKATSKLGSFDSNGNLNLNLENAPIDPPQTTTGNFSRYTSAGGFSFSGTSSSDTFPPSQILDLVAKQQDTTTYNSGIRIVFTAPGDDFDAGTASYYNIRYTYGDVLNLTTSFSSNRRIESADVLAGCITSPQIAGSEESFLILPSDLPEGVAEQSIGIAVTTVDDMENEGPVSNVVIVNYFIEPLTLDTPPPDPKSVEFILMIVFACTTAILLVGVVTVGILLRKRRKEKKLTLAVRADRSSSSQGHVNNDKEIYNTTTDP